jgi:hypothetical protein
MPKWNNMEISAEAHRIALKIKDICGSEHMAESYPVSGPVKTLLRNFYVATGGKRGADGYEPTAREYRRVYNGAISGAALIKAAGKQEAAKVEIMVEADKADAETEALAALKALLGGGKVDLDSVRAVAKEAVDGRVGEMLASMAGIIADEVSKQVRTIKIQVAEMPEIKVERAHRIFERALRFAANRKSFMLVGPAGSGKTTMVEQIAETLGLNYYLSGKCADEVKITGFIDGGGTYHRTAFRDAYEYGGVFLFDEMDGWSPDALIAINAPLAGKWGDFPDGKVRRHADFVAIGAANTFGRGADRQYVGREQLDAATLDRFAVIEMDYDEELELAIAHNRDWTLYVQKVRAAIFKEKIRHVCSPRASIEGSDMLAAGDAWDDVAESYIWKGIDTVVKNRVLAAMR